VIAAPHGSTPTEQEGRGRREAERAQREAQREAEQRWREIQRETEHARRDAQREAEQAWREAERAQRETQREAERAWREAQREAEHARREAQREWRELARYQWDGGRPWVERVVEIPAVGQSFPVSVLLPQTGTPAFPPNFANAVQTGVFPPLLQAVPPEAFSQTPLQFWPVQPNAFGMAHPSLYWAPDDHAGAQQFVSQLAAPGFQPVPMQGPLGEGIYLVVVLRLQ
jgi:hypothetical protein